MTKQVITFAYESAAWDWLATCQDHVAIWVQQLPNPVRMIQVTLTDTKRTLVC